MKKDINARWDTADEIKFLNKLGKHSSLKVDQGMLLKGYIKGLNLRSRFDELNKEMILSHAQKLLSKERQK